MNGQERLDEALRALAQADAGLGAGPAVEAAAMAVWRGRIVRPRRRRVAVRWGAIAAAAVVVMVGAWRWSDGRTAVAPVQEVAVASTTRTPPAPKAVTEAVVRPVRAPVKRTAGMPSRQAKSLRHPARAQAQEVVTEFFPLRPVPAWDDSVPAQMVRVRVPRSELGRFGLAFPGQFVDGTVRADVLVGQDGMARAVRFVR